MLYNEITNVILRLSDREDSHSAVSSNKKLKMEELLHCFINRYSSRRSRNFAVNGK